MVCSWVFARVPEIPIRCGEPAPPSLASVLRKLFSVRDSLLPLPFAEAPSSAASPRRRDLGSVRSGFPGVPFVWVLDSLGNLWRLQPRPLVRRRRDYAVTLSP